MSRAPVRIELLDWDSARPLAAPIRFAVFVEEQNVPEELEIDERDPHCVHALARGDDGRPTGTSAAWRCCRTRASSASAALC
jgi:predicted GNAT family N-acyltransferase